MASLLPSVPLVLAAPPDVPAPDAAGSGYRDNERRSRRVPDGNGEFRCADAGPAGLAWQRDRQAPVGTQSGRASVRSAHSAGGVPALPAASTPPTIAQVVSTSPPTWAVVQNAVS